MAEIQRGLCPGSGHGGAWLNTLIYKSSSAQRIWRLAALLVASGSSACNFSSTVGWNAALQNAMALSLECGSTTFRMQQHPLWTLAALPGD